MTTKKAETKMTIKSLTETVITLIERVEELESKLANVQVRDRGPKSTRTMTDDDAESIIWGDLKDLSHKEAAKKLGLSYNQIYSARGEYTFKHLWDKHLPQK